MSRHVTRVELTKDEVTLLLRCVNLALDAPSMTEPRQERRRERWKELLLLMDKLDHEYIKMATNEPVK